MGGFRTVCIENRAKCSYSGGYLVVTNGAATTKIHLSEISSLTFSTSQVYVSGYLMSELAKSKIPVVFCDEKCYPVAESLPLHGAHNCAARASAQLEWTLPSKKRLWQKVVRDKIELQAQVLSMCSKERESEILTSYAADVRSGDPTNREAAAASLYFAALFGPDFNRNQDTDINAALNYGYSVVLSKVCRELVSKGQLTQLEICHRSETNQWNLACDLMEPFRPFVDRVVITLGLEQFGTEAKRALQDIVNRSVPYRDGEYKFGSVMSLYVKDCIDALDKKIVADDIPCYEIA